ncbi:hypothetical protein EXN66_Car011433 [Channa argus]|uniref:Uncharacterized protein n=1 Tax=Channa argus TaxID=215402 RepID=A0A6G1PZT2_CHAAH|nr:hypothetical protein EXN66_Car011433 [Channa argus]
MSFGKDILLSCVVMMHVSFVVSEPANNLSECMKKFEAPLKNLRHAEKEYVRYMFQTYPAHYYKNNGCSSLEGITFPKENNTEEALAFMVNISNCIDILPAIIKNLTINGKLPVNDMISNITTFHKQFQGVLLHFGQNATAKECNVNDKNDYVKKQIGLKIICNTRRWVEKYTSPNIHGV